MSLKVGGKGVRLKWPHDSKGGKVIVKLKCVSLKGEDGRDDNLN